MHDPKCVAFSIARPWPKRQTRTFGEKDAPWEHATVPGWCPCKNGHPERCKPEEHPGSDHA